MDTTFASDEIQRQSSPPAVDEGLRSAGGIRWLLWIGALVVGVSVVGLVAARWGEWPLAVQFLVLVSGAVALHVAGDVARHRLRLPATGAALYFLFAALVPLLAWGAARLGLVEVRFGVGWISLGLGLGALLWASRRTLERVLEYRGMSYPAALAILLFALPVLSYFDDRGTFDERIFFITASITFGWVLRFACRHINRFFFHRDRVAGVDRPIHILPFALLALVYVGGMSLLAAFSTYLAVPLVVLSVVLIDTGEEYYKALVKTISDVPGQVSIRSWPRRSVGLLASGFALMAVAAAVSPVDSTLLATALVTTVAALRLFAWALVYQRPPAYAFAVASALVAYHFSPVLVPAVVKELFWQLVEALGIRSGSTAVVSLVDLGALAGLLLLGGIFLWRKKLTATLVKIHTAAVSFQAFLVLLAALPDPAAARTLMPLAVLLLSAAFFVLRRAELVPVFYLAVLHVAVVWGVVLLGAPARSFMALMSPEAAVVLAVVNLLFLGAALALRRLRPRLFAGSSAWMAAPPLAGAAATVLAALAWSSWFGLSGFLFLCSLTSVLLMGLLIGKMESGWAESVGELVRSNETWLGLAAVVLLMHPGSGAFFLALALAGFELARAWSSGSDSKYIGWRFQGWIGIAVVQALAAGWLAVGVYAAALALLVAAVAERVTADALERRGRVALARPSYPVAWILAALAGGLSVVNTLDASGWPWWPILPGFLSSLFFVFQARDGHARIFSSLAAAGFFTTSLMVVFTHLEHVGPEVYWLAPGLALIGLARLLAQEVGERWSAKLFTVGAGCLYAMPVLGLFEQLTWGWQIVMLLFSIAFGAASFYLKSRSLLTLSTAAVVIDLGFFLLKLGTTAPLLLWAVGIFFGLALMGCATLLEYRRELLLQKIRVWGREIRSWA